MRKIVSPVGLYIHGRRPFITQQQMQKQRHYHKVKSNLENAIAAEEEAAASAVALADKPRFSPLPEAAYKSPKMAVERRVVGENRDDVQAVVVRHVGREKMPASALGEGASKVRYRESALYCKSKLL